VQQSKAKTLAFVPLLVLVLKAQQTINQSYPATAGLISLNLFKTNNTSGVDLILHYFSSALRWGLNHSLSIQNEAATITLPASTRYLTHEDADKDDK
jgi:hypothetical protein